MLMLQVQIIFFLMRISLNSKGSLVFLTCRDIDMVILTHDFQPYQLSSSAAHYFD